MGSAAPITVPTKSGELVFNGNAKMGAIRRIMKAASTGDIDILIEGYSKIVMSWPFDGDPSDPEAWDELGRTEFNLVITAVAEGLSAAGE